MILMTGYYSIDNQKDTVIKSSSNHHQARIADEKKKACFYFDDSFDAGMMRSKKLK